MSLSRRAFTRSLAAGGAGALGAALVTFRGREAMAGTGLDERGPLAFPADPNEIRLDSNENPYGPGPAVLEAIKGAFGEAGRYPDIPTLDLNAALAKLHDVPVEQIVTGAGSTEILRMAVFAFTSATKPLVAGEPTFEDPGRQAAVAGSPVRTVRVDAALKLDLDGMAKAAEGAGLVFLCNPNNPTSTVHPMSAVADFVRKVNRSSPGTVILVDEAYHHFVEDPGYASAIPLALENPQVVVCRTFSKVYGMAGLRIGYAIGRPDTIAALRKHRLPSSVSVLGAVAAASALGQPDLIERQKQVNHDTRELTIRAFDSMGFKVVPPETNFIMVEIRRDAKAFQEACRAHKVLVGRPFPPLLGHARITIGTPDEMRRAIEVFRKVLGTTTTVAVAGVRPAGPDRVRGVNC